MRAWHVPLARACVRNASEGKPVDSEFNYQMRTKNDEKFIVMRWSSRRFSIINSPHEHKLQMLQMTQIYEQNAYMSTERVGDVDSYSRTVSKSGRVSIDK